jgi:hypothetical protein
LADFYGERITDGNGKIPLHSPRKIKGGGIVKKTVVAYDYVKVFFSHSLNWIMENG